MATEKKETDKIRSNSLSGDAGGGGSKKFYFLNTATPSPASAKTRNYQTMRNGGDDEEKIELGQFNGQG